MTIIYDLIAVGKLKKTSAFFPLYEEYKKRLGNRLSIREIEEKKTHAALEKIKATLSPDYNIVILDEKGHSQPSTIFAQKIDAFQNTKNGKLQIIIGGADGLSDDIRQQADMLLSFGKQTWPHMMVRVMLLEQLYRAEKIIANHPYHRE